MTDALTTIALVSASIFAASAFMLWRRPRRRLAGRVRPYAVPALSELGRPVVAAPVAQTVTSGPGLRDRLVALLHGGTTSPAMIRRLEQSGLYPVDGAAMLGEHRIRQVLYGLAGFGVGLIVGVTAGLAPIGTLALAIGAAASQSLRPAGAVDKAIENRRAALRGEIPPLCQLLALRLRASGSVVASLGQTVTRTQGILSDELREALAQHRAGRPLDAALEATATATPEPEAARVHRLLAASIRHGLDAAPDLLRLARDARTMQLTRLRRDATKKRAAILLPTIGLLAPLMILFIAAPLPGLVLGI